LTTNNKSSKLSSTSQTEANNKNEGGVMSNSENIVSSKAKEWTSPSPYQLPKESKKLSVFQLKDGTWATDNADAAVLLRMKFGSDKVIRSDKDFAKIKKIEQPSSSNTKSSNPVKSKSRLSNARERYNEALQDM
jgi:hypothetical protein